MHCGCTDSRACEGGCRWIQQHAATPTGVCSQCAAKQCQAVVIGKIFVGRNGPDTFWLEVTAADHAHRGEGMSMKEKPLAKVIEAFFAKKF